MLHYFIIFVLHESIFNVWFFIRLRSGRTSAKMVPPKNSSRPRNDTIHTEPPDTLTVGNVGKSKHVGVTSTILTPVATLTSLPGVVLLLPSVANIPTIPRATLTVVGDLTPSYFSSFTLPLGTRDYPYGMPTITMADLQSHISMFVDNDVTISSPLNPHWASGSTISNLGRMA